MGIPDIDKFFPSLKKTEKKRIFLSSLLRWVGPTEQIGTEDVRAILLRIFLCILQNVQNKETREVIEQNVKPESFNSNSLLQILKAKRNFRKPIATCQKDQLHRLIDRWQPSSF